MDTQATNELQEELNELEVTPTVTQERKDVVIEVTGFDLFGDVKL